MKFQLGSRRLTDSEYWDRSIRRTKGKVLASGRRARRDLRQSGRDDLAILREVYGQDIVRRRVLELGVGDGRIIRHLANTRCELFGLDVSEEALSMLRADDACREVTVIHQAVQDLDASELGTFDLIYSCFLFQHIASHSTIGSVLERVSAALIPGGVAALQFRKVTSALFIRDLASGAVRLPGPMPFLEPRWRGCRVEVDEAVQFARAVDASNEATVFRQLQPHHDWLRIERLQPT